MRIKLAAAAFYLPCLLAIDPSAGPRLRFQTILSGPIKPFGLAAAEGGRLFVADPGSRAVLIYDRKGANAGRLAGNSKVALRGPAGVAIGSRGRIFVSDVYRGQIVVFNPAGEPVAAFGSGSLKRPQGIAADPQSGRVYVGDVGLNQVIVFDGSTLQKEKAIGERTFASPSHLALNSKGNLYVTDMWNCRIQVFTPEGILHQRIAAQCGKPGEYDRPHAVAIDRDDRIYLADPTTRALEIFRRDGQRLDIVPALGPESDYVRTAIAFDEENRLYVAEQRQGEGRIQVFVRPR